MHGVASVALRFNTAKVELGSSLKVQRWSTVALTYLLVRFISTNCRISYFLSRRTLLPWAGPASVVQRSISARLTLSKPLQVIASYVS